MLDDIFGAPVPVGLIPLYPEDCPVCGGRGDYYEILYWGTFYSRAYKRPCPPPTDPVKAGCGGGGWFEVLEEII